MFTDFQENNMFSFCIPTEFVFGIDDKDISDTDVMEKSSEIIRDVVTELVIKPKIEEFCKKIER